MSSETASQITAWATVILVGVTGVYAGLTWALVRQATRSARSAAAAAEAMREANTIASASVQISFEVELNSNMQWDAAKSGPLVAKCTGATVHLLGVEIVWAAGPIPGETMGWERIRELNDKVLVPDSRNPLPLLLHRGEEAEFLWPGPPMNPLDPLSFADLRVIYDIAGRGDVRRLRVPMKKEPPDEPGVWKHPLEDDPDDEKDGSGESQ